MDANTSGRKVGVNMDANQRPLARSRELLVEEVGDELLVYDLEANHGHCLSASAARVWQRCDGKTQVDALGRDLDLDPATVERALDELTTCALLERIAESAPGSIRRELTTRVMKVGAAAAAVPLIVSVVAPTPAMAVTLAFCQQFSSTNCGGGSPSEGCKSNGCCCCQPPAGPGAFRNCVDVQANCPAQTPAVNSCN